MTLHSTIRYKNSILLITLLSLCILSFGKDCVQGCGGCERGRCDVFGCSEGAFCCIDLLNQYGACCSSCGPKCPDHCTTCDSTGKCTQCDPSWYGPRCDVSQQCATPIGTDCSFYSQCMDTSCPFVSQVELAKCEEYKQLEPTLSSNGQVWSKYVRACLQKSLGQNLLQKKGSSYTCDEAKNDFLDAHIPCYLDGPIDFCSIDLMDKIKVFWHAKEMLTEAFWEVIKSAGKLKWNCDNRFYEGVLRKISKSGPTSHPIVTPKQDPFQILRDELYNISTKAGWESRVDLTDTTSTFNVGFQRQTLSPNVTVNPQITAEWIVGIAAKLGVWNELVLDGVTYPIKNNEALLNLDLRETIKSDITFLN